MVEGSLGFKKDNIVWNYVEESLGLVGSRRIRENVKFRFVLE